MTDRMDNHRLFQLDKEIQEELQSMTKNIGLLSEGQVERDLYNDYNYRLISLQRRFDEAGELLKGIPLTQENPDLYEVLETKDRITANYGVLGRLQRELAKLFHPEQEREEERSREEIFGESVDQPEEEPEEQSLEEESPDLDEAALLEELEAQAEREEIERKKAKQKAEQKRQKEFAKAGKEAEERAQKLSEKESEPSYFREEKSGTEVFLERAREEESRLFAQRLSEERKEEHRKTMEKFRERMDASDHFTLDQKGHFDFSEGGSQPTRFSEEQRPEERKPLDPLRTVETPSSQRRTQPIPIYSQEQRETFRSDHYSDLRTTHATGQNSSHTGATAPEKPHPTRKSESPVQESSQALRAKDPVPGSRVDEGFVGPVFYQYAPGGRVSYQPIYPKEMDSAGQHHAQVPASFEPSHSHPKSLSNHSDILSIAAQAQLRARLESARQEYLEKRGTPQAAAAAHTFLQQRNIYSSYRASHGLEERKADLPNPAISEPKIGKPAPVRRVVEQPGHFQYSPWGVEGYSVDRAGYSGSRFHRFKEGTPSASVSPSPQRAPLSGFRPESQPYRYPKESPDHLEHRPTKRIVRDLPKTLDRDKTIAASQATGHGAYHLHQESSPAPVVNPKPAPQRKVEVKVSPKLPKTLDREKATAVSQSVGHTAYRPYGENKVKPSLKPKTEQNRKDPSKTDPILPKKLDREKASAVSQAVGQATYRQHGNNLRGPSSEPKPGQPREESSKPVLKIPKTLNREKVMAASLGIGSTGYRYRLDDPGKVRTISAPKTQKKSSDLQGATKPTTQIHFDKGGRYRVTQPLPRSASGGSSGQKSGGNASRTLTSGRAGNQGSSKPGGNKPMPTPSGTTFQPKTQNPNQVKKQAVKQTTANVTGWSRKLRTKAIVSRYAGRIGSRLEAYTPYAVSRLSRKMYTMMQSGEDNALRTFETGRYYMTTGVAVTYAVTHAHVVNSALFEKKGAKKITRQYRELKGMSRKELNRTIHENLKYNRASKAEIKALMDKGADLTGEERKTLLFLMKDHASSSMDARKYYGYRKLQYETKMKVAVAQRLEEKKKVLVSRGQIESEMKRVRTTGETRIKKKFGNLSKVPDKDLNKTIGTLKRQGKDLKQQIKALKGKGAVLTVAEQKQLTDLLAKHKRLNKKLSKLIGLKQAREKLRTELGVLGSFRNQILRNRAKMYGGLIALQGFLLKPLQEGSEIGAQGLSKFAMVASNRNVHRLIKTTWKHSMRASGYIADKTGLKKLSKKTTQAIAKTKPATAVRSAKQAVKTSAANAKQAVKTSAATTKQAVIQLTPNKVKTAVHRGSSTINQAKTAVRGVINKGKQAFAKTWVGRTFSKVSSTTSKAVSALKAALAVVKGVAIKVGLGVLAVFLIVQLITSGAISSIIGAVSSMIMSPYSEEDGMLDLGPYVSIVREEQAEFEEEINSLGTQKNYDNVYINYLTGTMDNTKEMLSMMAVRLNQDLDIESNSKVEEYLESLFWDSHVYTTSEREYKCSGCQTKTVTKTRVDPETGEEETYTVTKKYCPGHIDLTIEISVLGFDEIFSADSMGNAEVLPGNVAAGDLIGRFKITYYCTEKYPHICNAGPPYKTATGTTPTAGRTIAVDPSIIPLGSHVIIDGHEYIAEDTGGAIDDYRIDICVDKHQTALSKGTRNSVPVYSVSINAPTQEQNTDTEGWNGWTEENIEWCKTIYQQNWAELYTGITDYGGIIEGDGGELIISGEFTWPVTTTTMISSNYGWRTINGERDFHNGIDIPVPVGTPIHAAADGTVTVSKYSSSGGYMISINHGNGIVTRYLHNSRLYVNVGDKVSAGDVIALSGNTGRSTGPHLHFDISVNGSYVNPSKYFDF